MSKIFEALQNAEADRKRVKKIPDRPPVVEILPRNRDISNIPSLPLEMEMLQLAQSISSLLPDPGKNVIQFIGSREGEGTSTIVREFARVLVQQGHKAVLLVDGDPVHPDQHRLFGVKPKPPLEKSLHEGQELEDSITQIPSSNLFLSTLSGEAAPNPELLPVSQDHDIWEPLRKKFSFILVSSSPVSETVDGLALSSKVDGVVLVVEAEKTSSHVAKKVKEKITQAGGNLLGMVFNKQKFYIPSWVYKWL